jgi:ABC-type Co2+ transport system permease subunit
VESLPYVLTTGWASGVNVYATVLVTGLLGRFGGVDGVPDVLQRTDVLLVAAVLFGVEFVADKIPYVDSAWDGIHTVIRPTVGAVLGALLAGEADDLGEAVAAVLGGSTALASHAVKASLRLAVNTSPKPASNIVASVAEDSAVVGVLLLAVDYPWIALAVAVTLLTAGGILAVLIISRIRRAWRRFRGRLDAGVPP